MEYLILRWQSGEAAYPLKAKQRDFSITEPHPQSLHLIDGGRWLLFTTLDGSVKYYDLNSRGKSLDAITLLPTQFDKDAYTFTLLAVDLDPDAEYLTFNLASVTCLVYRNPGYLNTSQPTRWIEVNRVTSYWDENGDIKGLRAEPLAFFREENLYQCDSFTIRGRFFAYTFRAGIVIVDWTSADPTSLVYPRRVIWQSSVTVSTL